MFGSLTGVAGKGGGACSAFPMPSYAIAGKTAYDQKWADETTEAGIAGCGWKRPARRPASLDARPKAANPAAPVAPARKHHWYNLLPRPKAAAPEVNGG